ncbi:MAG: pirin family protein [Patescibacteria group bacterium]
MIKKVPATDRHFNDFGSLKTYWLFSFSDYVDRDNMEFGALRVFNDDIIMPGKGFPEHPHDTMEIVTVVFDGTLTHTDSMGNEATISKGEVQRMSAGKGVLHSEYNKHDTPVHLYQLWFYPNTDTTADYEQKQVDTSITQQTILASEHESSGVTLYSDAVVSELQFGMSSTFTIRIAKGWGVLLYVREGSVIVRDVEYHKGDQARITEEEEVLLMSTEGACVFMVETRM